MKIKHPLKSARIKRGISPDEAAKILKVHPMSIYFWESGKKLPRPENLEKIEKVFGITPCVMAETWVDLNRIHKK